MRTVLCIFTRDLKRILHNPAAIVIALGVCIIPSLYAWINILANWNPYENTATVPVAVVINTRSSVIPDMGHVNAGEMIREKLEENHQLGWSFVGTEEEAKSAVEAGRAYAAFVIPRNFSVTLAGVLDGKDRTGAYRLLREREGERYCAQGDRYRRDHARDADTKRVRARGGRHGRR